MAGVPGVWLAGKTMKPYEQTLKPPVGSAYKCYYEVAGRGGGDFS
jgi:hypothetical protein